DRIPGIFRVTAGLLGIQGHADEGSPVHAVLLDPGGVAGEETGHVGTKSLPPVSCRPVSWPAKAGYPRLSSPARREIVGGRPSLAMTQRAETARVLRVCGM